MTLNKITYIEESCEYETKPTNEMTEGKSRSMGLKSNMLIKIVLDLQQKRLLARWLEMKGLESLSSFMCRHVMGW